MKGGSVRLMKAIILADGQPDHPISIRALKAAEERDADPWNPSAPAFIVELAERGYPTAALFIWAVINVILVIAFYASSAALGVAFANWLVDKL